MPILPRLTRILPLFLASGLCAGNSLAATTPPADKAKPTAKPKVQLAEPDKALMQDGLDAATLYQYLLAEIAAGRGELDVATQAYMDMARRLDNPLIARRATELSLATRQWLWAKEAAQLWIKADPSSVQALQTMVFIQANAGGRIEDLEQALTRLLLANPQARAEMLMQLPRTYSSFPDRQVAAASIVRVTEAYVSMPESHIARAAGWLAAEQREQAEASARQALALRPDWELAVLVMTQVAPSERTDVVMRELSEFAARNPSARDSRITYLRWLTTKDDKAATSQYYLRMLSDFPKDDELAFSVAVAAVKQRDHATAEAVLKRLIDSNFREADLLKVQLGQELEAEGKQKEARSAYEAVDPTSKHYVAARLAAAQLLVRQGQLAEARQVLQKAAATVPERTTELVRAEASLLVNQGKLAEASELLEARLLVTPEDNELLYDAGMMGERLGRVDLMEKHLRKLISLKPDHAHAYNALGYTLADRNIRLDEAEALLTKALSLADDDAAILDSVGWLYFRKGDMVRAVEYLKRSHAKMPDPEVSAHLVEALWAAGKKEEALSVLQQAQKLNPQNPQLIKLAKRLAQ